MTVHKERNEDDGFVRTITLTLVNSISQPGWSTWCKAMATIVVLAIVAIALRHFGLI